MRLGLFLVSFVLLQYGWTCAQDSRLQRWVIDDATVGTSVVLIDWLTPGAAAVADGNFIRAAGGGLLVRSGCDGTEVLFLLFAALLACPLEWKRRLSGLLGSTVLVFALNQLRLLALFYSSRSDPVLFDRIHGLIAPLLLSAAVLAYFAWLLRRSLA